MSEPGFLYLDSDIFVLHAGAGVLPDLISAAGFEVADARRLQPLPHMLRRGSLHRRYSAAVRERTEAWCSQIPPIRKAPSAEVVDQLVRLADMDPGEALFFASAAEADPARVATGDKRACRALSTADDLDELKALLKGKVICLEGALFLLLDQIGYPALVRAFTPVRDCNQTLRILLSQGERTSEEAFRSGLESYWADASRQAGELLLPRG